MADTHFPYSEKVMDHFRNPRNVGVMENPSGVGKVGNPICGDVMELFIKVENGVITDAKFRTFGCLPPEEEVVTEEGGWEKISLIKKGRVLLDSEGKRTEVIEEYEREYTGMLLKITPCLSPFNTFCVTPEHPVLAVKREWVEAKRRNLTSAWLVDKEKLADTKCDYLKAKYLRPSDYLIYVFNPLVEDHPFFTKEVMRLVGYYLAEGYLTAQGGGVAFTFPKEERRPIREIKKLLFKVAQKEPKERVKGNASEVYVGSKKLASFLQEVAGPVAGEKSLNPKVMLLPFEKQWEMVKACFPGDGVLFKRRTSHHTFRVITTSRRLAIQIQEILARGGIFTSIQEVGKTSPSIGSDKIKDSIIYNLRFVSKKSHHFPTNNKYFLVPIKKVEKVDYQGPVYNLQVAFEPNTYLIKGFAVHNCGAAIATSSMVTELVKGKRIEEALKISNKAVVEALGGLPPLKMHCSLLAEEALKSAIEDYRKREASRKETGKC